jgi:hypothetical protein
MDRIQESYVAAPNFYLDGNINPAVTADDVFMK